MVNVDNCLESFLCLVYQQILGEWGICCQSNIYLGGCGLSHAHLFIDHCRISCFFFSACLIFAVGLDREMILTVKFSWSMVVRKLNCSMWSGNKTLCWEWSLIQNQRESVACETEKTLEVIPFGATPTWLILHALCVPSVHNPASRLAGLYLVDCACLNHLCFDIYILQPQ